MQADGRVIIDTSIDTDGLVAGSEEIEQSLRRMAGTLGNLSTSAKAALQKQLDSFSRLNSQYNEQAQKVDALRQKVAALGQEKVPTQEYAEIQKQISDAQSSLDSLIRRQEKFLALGGNTNSRAYRSMQYDIDELANSIKYAKGELEALEQSGNAFKIGGNEEAVKAAMEQLAREESKLADMNNRLGTSYAALKGKMEQYEKGLNKTDKAQKKATESGDNFGKTAKRNQMTLGRMLTMSLLMSVAFRALSAVTSGIAEGFSNLAQYSEETNATLSSLMSSLTQLKNAFATAFAPILTVVAPALNYMIGLLVSATTALAHFMAALTGKNTYVKATKVQQNYADSLKQTGSAADAAKKSLLSFDQLEQLSTGSQSGGSGGSESIDPSEMFETVEVADSLTAAIAAAKDRLLELAGIFKTGFLDGFGDLSVIDSIGSSLASIKASLVDIFSSAEVTAAAEGFANQVVYDLGRVAGAVASIGASVADNFVGGLSLYLESSKDRISGYIVSMFNIGSRMSEIKGDLAAAISTVFSSLRSSSAKRITSDLIAIFAEGFMGVTKTLGSLTTDLLGVIVAPFTENADYIRSTLENVFTAIEPIFGSISDLVTDVFDTLSDVYERRVGPMLSAFRTGFSSIGATFLTVYNTHFVPVLANLSEKFSTFNSQYLTPLISRFLEFGGSVANAITVLWTSVLQPLVEWWIGTFAPGFSTPLTTITDLFFVFAGTVSTAIESTMAILTGLIDFIIGVFTGDFNLAWQGVVSIFSGVWNLMKNIVTTALNVIRTLISGTWNQIRAITESIWTGILTRLTGIWTTIQTTVQNVWTTIQAITTELWTTISDFLFGLWDTAKTTAETTFGSLKDAVVGVWETLSEETKRIWDGIWGTIKGVINSIIGGVESMVNRVIDGINSMIDAVNDVASYLPGVSDDLIPNIPSITLPRLASGTVVPPRAGEFAAILGDNNRETEVVSPLSTMKQAMIEAMQEAGGVSGNGNEIKVVLQFNGSMRSLVRAMKPELDRESVRQGVQLVTTGGV